MAGPVGPREGTTKRVPCFTLLGWRPSRFLHPKRGAGKFVVLETYVFISKYKQLDRGWARNPAALCCSRKRATLLFPLSPPGGWEAEQLYHALHTLSGSLPCSTSDCANREEIYAMVRDGREG